jgi:hypothetical protein
MTAGGTDLVCGPDGEVSTTVYSDDAGPSRVPLAEDLWASDRTGLLLANELGISVTAEGAEICAAWVPLPFAWASGGVGYCIPEGSFDGDEVLIDALSALLRIEPEEE